MSTDTDPTEALAAIAELVHTHSGDPDPACPVCIAEEALGLADDGPTEEEAEAWLDSLDRDGLVDLCELAVVPHGRWRDRDSASSQTKAGSARALLRAGCDYEILRQPESDSDRCVSDRSTVWLRIRYRGFAWFEGSPDPDADRDEFLDDLLVYLPTPWRLQQADGKDWY